MGDLRCLVMSATELINGIVRAGPDAATRYAADFRVLLHRGDFESYAGASRADLTARWSGGTEFVDLNPSPYLVLVLVDEPAEYRILGIRPLSDVLLLLTVEPKDGGSQARCASRVDRDDELDEISNSVIGLIRDRHFDEALAVCERLRVEYPDVHDWLECSAMVHEARGENGLALDFYRLSVAFLEAPERRDDYDEELIDTFRVKIAALEALLPARR